MTRADTPMMRQWSRIKRENPACVVLFRLGDFYEAFHEDAAVVAEVCDVTLTSRPVRKGERAPMAGVPYHAVDGYIGQLVRAGHRVAIVEQSGDASPDKRARMSRRAAAAPDDAEAAGGSTLLERFVARVVTPGTLVEADLIDPRANHYLAAVVAGQSAAGLAHADLSTGEFRTTAFDGPGRERMVWDELVRLRPAEVLVPAGGDGHGDALGARLREGLAAAGLEAVVMPWLEWRFDTENARRALLDHFGAVTLGPYGCDDLPEAAAAAGAVLAYAAETQRARVTQLAALTTYRVGDRMTLDAATRRNLELVVTLRGEARRGTLLSVIDLSVTAMGGRALRRWLDAPLLDRAAIESRLDGVEALVSDEGLRRDVRGALKGMPDLERLTNRVVAGYAGPRELLSLADAARRVPELRARLAEAGALPERLSGLCGQAVTAVAERIEATIADEPPAVLGIPGVVRDGHSGELDAVHSSVADARAWIAGLEERERERTGIGKLKVGYNKVFGYYLSVPKSLADRVPGDYDRKQTLVDAERYVTPDLKAREAEVLGAEERIIALERQLFEACLDDVAVRASDLLSAARDVAALDAFAALAEAAVRHRYTRPLLDDGRGLAIRQGRHPVVERVRTAEPFVPNDVAMAEGEILLLTGPNMAGKSTVGRQVALIALLAQIGSFVPAEEARLGVVDRIFTRIGAQDELAAGQSTFMVEMVETAGILHHATPRSLIVLDELGRGTSTYDGIAIAWAVLEHIHGLGDLGVRTLFATHYHELTALSDTLPRLRNISMAVRETSGGIAFLHQVVPGPADRSYGVHVAELAGLPREVVARAWAILARLESEDDVPLQDARRRPPPSTGGQLPLFAPVEREHPVVAVLRDVEIERLTPLEALLKLAELKRQAGG